MSFEQWMDRLDRCCQLDFGLSIDRLPAMNFRDAYDTGLSPEEFLTENLPDEEALGRAMAG